MKIAFDVGTRKKEYVVADQDALGEWGRIVTPKGALLDINEWHAAEDPNTHTTVAYPINFYILASALKGTSLSEFARQNGAVLTRKAPSHITEAQYIIS